MFVFRTSYESRNPRNEEAPIGGTCFFFKGIHDFPSQLSMFYVNGSMESKVESRRNIYEMKWGWDSDGSENEL